MRAVMSDKIRMVLSVLMVAVLFCVILLCCESAVAGTSRWGQVVHQKDSLYHRVFVYRSGSFVTLRFGKRPSVPIQSQVKVDDLRAHMLEYTGLSFCGLLYNSDPNKILVLGLGGGVIPREMHHYFPEAEIDVAEIDPEVESVAKEFFGFRTDEKLRVHIEDGRIFIKKQFRVKPVVKYDMVILDAFNSEYIPFHLMTKEFFEEIKGILADDGVVVANVFYTNRLFEAEFKTIQAVFDRCQVFSGASCSNAMIVGLGGGAEELTVREAVSRGQAVQSRVRGVNMVAVARQLSPNPRLGSSTKVLTDDRAPVNRLRTQQRSRRP